LALELNFVLGDKWIIHFKYVIRISRRCPAKSHVGSPSRSSPPQATPGFRLSIPVALSQGLFVDGAVLVMDDHKVVIGALLLELDLEVGVE
jgi:hypothetical protein